MTDREALVTEREAMERALALAERGWGHVSPNPLVGAVLLKDGRVVAEGFHEAFGAPHAEAVAIAACPDPTGATCVVNLEPCAHHGKTPPCTDILREAGIARVVYAVPDPHPAAGRGADILRSHGIEVERGVCAAEGAALNAPFLWSHRRGDRPFVALKLAVSVDGFVADRWGSARWISDERAREFVHWLRAGFDAIAVGRRTVERDDPRLTVRGAVQPRVVPTRVVFSRSGALDLDRAVVKTAGNVPTVLVTAPEAGTPARERLMGTDVEVVAARTLVDAMRALRERGVRSLLVEGGGELGSALLEADLVDRAYLIGAPVLLGDGVRAFGRRTPVRLADATRWIPTQRKALGDGNLLVVDRGLCSAGS